MNTNSVTVTLNEAENSCFVIMPFGNATDRVYEKVFKPAISKANLKPVRGDEIFGHRRIMSDIWDSIRSCRCVLAELTGKNSNVLYELGLSHAIGKPVVIVTSDINDVPFDLRDIRCIVYDKNQPDWGELLREDITKTINGVIQNHDSGELLKGIEVFTEYPAIEPQSELNEKVTVDVSGTWKLEEKYTGGFTEGTATLFQSENDIKGKMLIFDTTSDGDTFVVEQSVSGFVKDRLVTLVGTSFTIIQGDGSDYGLDKWEGELINNIIEGRSIDDHGITGTFKLERV